MSSRSATATLVALGVGAAGESATASARALPVRGELAGVLPWGGLRRGSTVSVRGSTSLLLALLAEATSEGCWAAVVGLPRCGALAAAELGVAVHRLALVPRPGRDQGEVERTVAALLDGFDLVSVATPVTPSAARKLSARARHRKAVLLPFGGVWPGADVELRAASGRWTGLGEGHGLLTDRTVTVRATGRGAAARERTAVLPLPGVPARGESLPRSAREPSWYGGSPRWVPAAAGGSSPAEGADPVRVAGLSSVETAGEPAAGLGGTDRGAAAGLGGTDRGAVPVGPGEPVRVGRGVAGSGEPVRVGRGVAGSGEPARVRRGAVERGLRHVSAEAG